MQIGFCTYEPKYCRWKKFLPYTEMTKYVSEARIVITHGGPASFVMPLQIGKTPIVVPRQKKFDEHINDHQVEFTKKIAEKMGTILLVEEIENLENVITNYDSLIKKMNQGIQSNNLKFNQEFEIIIKNLFET